MELESINKTEREKKEDRLQNGKKYVRSLLSFEIASNTPWTMEGNSTNDEMIKDIVSYKQKYDGVPLLDGTIRKFRDDFIYQMSIDEEVGFQDRSSMDAATVEHETERRPFQIINSNVQQNSIKQKEKKDNIPKLEHKNMLKAWEFFDRKRKKSQGILSMDLVTEAHGKLMKDLITNAGELSENPRSTVCPIKKVSVGYPNPIFIKKVYQTLMDYANFMAEYFKEMIDTEVTEDSVLEMIKFFAWFFSSFVQLHPYTDGNGRLSRLLYYYLQSFLTPFAVGIYNIHAPTSKNDYLRAIAQVREDTHKTLAAKDSNNEFRINNWQFDNQPVLLARMILECQWHGWKKFDSVMKHGDTAYASPMSSEESPSSSLES